MFDIDWVGLLVPLSYLSILIGSLATFSSLYRKRKLARSATLEPWFPPHLQRNIYLSLLHLDPADPSSTPAHADRSLSNVPDSIIKAALMRRAVEDIHRIIQIRNSKPALQGLLQRGSVGDELWQRFQRAEKEIEEEVKDVVSEVSNQPNPFRFVSFRFVSFQINIHIHMLTRTLRFPPRQTPSRQAGARSSSNPQTKSQTTSWPDGAWPRSKPSCRNKRSGGTDGKRTFPRAS